MSSERLSGIKSMEQEAAKTLLNAMYHPKIEDPSNHLVEIQDLLGRGYNLVLYSNHIAFDDPVVETLFHSKYLDPKHERHLIVPASHWHINPEHSKTFYAATKAAEFIFGAEVVPVVQKYMVEEGKYTEQEANDINAVFRERLQDLHKKNTPTTVLIYPEAHRSDDGQLKFAEDGFVGAGRIISPTVFAPIGIYYETPFSRDGVNFQHHVHISIGKPYGIRDKSEKPIVSDLMQNLAQCLPQSMRGYYR